MLHILLMILKIIGIIILILLGIILSLLLIVLFVPIQYRFSGKKDKSETEGTARISWLFGLISFIVSYKENNRILKLRILGIDLMKLLKKQKEKKAKPRKRTDKTNKIEDTKTEDCSRENIKKETSGITDGSKISKEQTDTDKIVSSVKKIKLTITNICDKIKYWNNFLSDERTRGALLVSKDQLFHIVRHIFPRKIKGQITYGFEDPCTTGQVLAGISVVYPLYYRQLSICPDFSGQVFIGDLKLKGRIYIIYLLKCSLAILFNKDIQFIIHTFRSKEES